MKRCSKCHIWKDESEFTKNKSKKDGLSPLCKLCKREDNRKNYPKYKDYIVKSNYKRRKKLKEEFQKFKLTLKCELCPENHPAALDFHHMDPSEKEGNIAQFFLNVSKKRFLEEIAKCRVLCSNCHRKLHWEENNTLS